MIVPCIWCFFALNIVESVHNIFSNSANKKETIAWCGDDLLLHEVKQDAFYIVHSDIREFGFAIRKC